MKLKSLAIITIGILSTLISCNNNSKNTSENIKEENKNKTIETPKEIEEKPISSKTKIRIFSEIEKTKQILSENGIGTLGEWKSDQMGGFFSITKYYEIKNELPPNTLSYNLESEHEDYIESLKLILSINNKSNKKEALSKFKEITISTFNKLSLELPKELINTINKENEFQESNSNFSTSLNIFKNNNTEIYTLKIKTK